MIGNRFAGDGSSTIGISHIQCEINDPLKLDTKHALVGSGEWVNITNQANPTYLDTALAQSVLTSNAEDRGDEAYDEEWARG